MKNVKTLCGGNNDNKVLSDIKEQSELVDVKESQNPDNEGLLPTPSVISDDATQIVESQLPVLALNLETNDDITGGPGLDKLCDRWRYDQELNNQVCQKDGMILTPGQDSMVGDVVTSVEQNNEVCVKNVKELCKHNKRGYCIEHKVKGNRSEIKYKAWRKKKYGYGYVTTKKVMYSCPVGNVSEHTDTAVNLENSVSTPVLSTGEEVGFVYDNIQRDNRVGISNDGMDSL